MSGNLANLALNTNKLHALKVIHHNCAPGIGKIILMQLQFSPFFIYYNVKMSF